MEEKNSLKKFDKNEILTLAEVSEYLKISKSYIHRLIKEQAFPFIQLKPRGRLLFRKKSIDRWIALLEKPTPPEIKREKIKLIRRK